MKNNIYAPFSNGKLEEKDQKVVEQYTSDLLVRMNNGKYGNAKISEVVLNNYSCNKYREVSKQELQEVNGYIRVNKLIGEEPLFAFLTTEFKGVYKDNSKYEAIKSKLLYVILELMIDGKHESSIIAACDRTRLLAHKKYRWLFDELPDFKNDLKDIEKELANLRDKYKEEKKEKRIADIHVIVRDFNERKPGVKREKGTDEVDKKEIVIIQRAQYCEEDEEYKEIVCVEACVKGDQSKEEINNDQWSSEKWVESRLIAPQSYSKALLIKFKHEKEKANAIAMREMLLPCDIGLLTDYEIKMALMECYEKAMGGCIASLMICLSIIFGRQVDELIGVIWASPGERINNIAWVKGGNRAALGYTLDVPNTNLTSIEDEVYEKHEETIYFIVPGGLGGTLIKAKKISIDEKLLKDEIKERIKECNKKHNLNLTSIRLAKYAYSYLLKKGVDRADAGLVCGVTTKNNPALYYYSPLREKVIGVYEMHVNHIFSLIDKSPEFDRSKLQPGRMGSRIQIDRDYVARLFDELAKEINYVLEDSSIDIAVKHNLYVIYTYLLLSISSGHRPVKAPFEYLGDINLINGQMWLSDKEVRSAAPAGLLVLPQAAINQLEKYKTHLKELQSKLMVSKPRVSEYIKGVYENKSKLLFFINEDDVEVVRIMTLRNKMKKIWPVKENWPRHFMRTELSNEGLNGELNVSFMRHEGFNQEALGKYSGLSINDLKTVSRYVSKVLVNLGINAINGLK